MGAASLEELRTVAFVRGADSVGLHPPQRPAPAGEARLLAYEADRTVLSVRSRDRALLVYTMNFSAFWHAYVDDREVHVKTVDSTFIGVPVPGGSHRVELRYQPPYAWLLPG